MSLIAIVSKDLNINVRTITEISVDVVYNGSRTLLVNVTMSRSSVVLAL